MFHHIKREVCGVQLGRILPLCSPCISAYHFLLIQMLVNSHFHCSNKSSFPRFWKSTQEELGEKIKFMYVVSPPNLLQKLKNHFNHRKYVESICNWLPVQMEWLYDRSYMSLLYFFFSLYVSYKRKKESTDFLKINHWI